MKRRSKSELEQGVPSLGCKIGKGRIKYLQNSLDNKHKFVIKHFEHYSTE